MAKLSKEDAALDMEVRGVAGHPGGVRGGRRLAGAGPVHGARAPLPTLRGHGGGLVRLPLGSAVCVFPLWAMGPPAGAAVAAAFGPGRARVSAPGAGPRAGGCGCGRGQSADGGGCRGHSA